MKESLFEKIKSVLEEIDVCYPYMECCEGEFFANNHEFYYVSRGDVYSGEVKEGVATKDDCTFINYDTGCGETITKVLLTKNRISPDLFYEKYEDCM
tara:strand:- start:120915 stop:121205 length:291 start_codon:yes stop_codon:yes gene_type:complete